MQPAPLEGKTRDYRGFFIGPALPNEAFREKLLYWR